MIGRLAACAHLLARRAEWVVAGLWLFAYAIVVAAGQPFLPGYLDYGWQIIPWTVLKDDPITSVWYLHTQPPLWNLTLGVLGKLTPFGDARTLQALQVVLGMILAWQVARILRNLGLRARWIIALAAAVTVNPEVLRNALEPTYETATGVGLACAVLALQRLARDRRSIDFVAFSAALTAVVLTRSLYHPALLVLCLLAVGVAYRRLLTRASVIVAVLIPTLLVGGWLVKNAVLFDRATLSSWVGMNLQRSTIPILSLDDLAEMRASGQVSEIAEIGPFGNYGLYRDSMPPCTPQRVHPALSQESHLDAAGVIIPNFNFECFLPVYDQAGKDFRAVLKEHPEVWVKGRIFSLKMTFATSNLAADSASKPLRTLDQLYRLLRVDVHREASTLDWGTPIYGRFKLPFRFSLAVVAIYAALAIAAAVALLRGIVRLRRRAAEGAATPSVWSATVAFIGVVGAFTVIVGAVGELGEQARFRSMTDPLALSVGAVLIYRLLRRWLGRPEDNAQSESISASAS